MGVGHDFPQCLGLYCIVSQPMSSDSDESLTMSTSDSAEVWKLGRRRYTSRTESKRLRVTKSQDAKPMLAKLRGEKMMPVFSRMRGEKAV